MLNYEYKTEEFLSRNAGKYVKSSDKITVYNNFIDFYRGGIIEVEHLKGLKRGACVKFSTQARKRFIKQMDSAVNFVPCLLVTLTYKYFQDDMKGCYDDLQAFCRSIFSDKYICFWKKEFQERGVVHFHLISNFTKEDAKKMSGGVKQFYVDVKNKWNSIVHRSIDYPSTKCDWVRSVERSELYVSLYYEKKGYQTLAPVDRLLNGYVGRWWGVFNKSLCVFKDPVLLSFKFPTIKFFDMFESLIHKDDDDDYDYKEREHYTNFVIKNKDVADFLSQNIDFFNEIT